MSDCRQCADFDWCAEHEDCGLFKQKPITNADRIRGMTDEELANHLAAEQYVGIRTFLLGFDKELLEDLDEEIKMAWPEAVKDELNWLKQETTDG